LRVPEPGEIRFPVTGTRCRRGEIRPLVGSAGYAGRRIVEPLSVAERRTGGQEEKQQVRVTLEHRPPRLWRWTLSPNLSAVDGSILTIALAPAGTAMRATPVAFI